MENNKSPNRNSPVSGFVNCVYSPINDVSNAITIPIIEVVSNLLLINLFVLFCL